MKTPRGLRCHIGLFGRRNAGKSSLLNALVKQDVSIVSEIAGTTTDPVEKPVELLPIGSVQFIDTAGVDDTGALGQLRIEKTLKTLDRTDLGIIVVPAGEWTEFEESLLTAFCERKTPVVVAFNKSDTRQPDDILKTRLADLKIPALLTTATTGGGVSDLRQAIIRTAPDAFLGEPALVSDLVPPGGLAVLVIPIDKEAPKGRLILPQVQTLRDLLDNDSCALVVKERELRDALAGLNRKPSIVITDSQAFLKVAADTPDSVPMTSFSILFARYKGELSTFVLGAMAIEKLKPGARVLIAESCSHHAIADDIGRVKIPRWLRQFVGGDLDCTVYAGHDFPADLASYSLVVHCGACMTNRREVLRRMELCRSAGVPITNYGIAIAYSLGIFERALRPFPHALDVYKNALRK